MEEFNISQMLQAYEKGKNDGKSELMLEITNLATEYISENEYEMFALEIIALIKSNALSMIKSK